MKLSQMLTLFVVLLVAAYIAHEAWGDRETPAIVAARDTMRIIEVRRDTITQVIQARERVVQHYDTVVQNVTDTTVVIQRDSAPPDTVVVPREVIQRDIAKDSLIAGYRVDRRLDSLWHIQDAKLPHKPPPRYSLGMNVGYGCNPNGCGPTFSVGVNIKVP